MGNALDARGKPTYTPTPTQTVADLQAAVDFADKIGGLLKGTNADRLALTSGQVSVGWIFSETDTGNVYLRTASGWDVLHYDTGMLTLTPPAGWTAFDSGLKCRRDGSVVTFTFAVSHGGWSELATWATLPADCRPAAAVHFLSIYTGTVRECTIDSSGVARVNVGGSGGLAGTVTFNVV